MLKRCLNSDVRTLLFAFVCIGRPDDGSLVVDDDNALHVLVSLHAIECFLHF